MRVLVGLKGKALLKRYTDDSIDEIELVKMVEKYPELYDQNHINYSNEEHKGEIWEAIATDLGVAGRVQLCEQKWWDITGEYLEKLDQTQSKYEKRYHYLEFLLPYFIRNGGFYQNDLSIQGSDEKEIEMTKECKILDNSLDIHNENNSMNPSYFHKMIKSDQMEISNKNIYPVLEKIIASLKL